MFQPFIAATAPPGGSSHCHVMKVQDLETPILITLNASIEPANGGSTWVSWICGVGGFLLTFLRSYNGGECYIYI